jgi:hypothetical protein
VAGYEAPALGIAHCLFELAINQSIQNKLREEVQNAYDNNNRSLNADMLNALPYLEATIGGNSKIFLTIFSQNLSNLFVTLFQNHIQVQAYYTAEQNIETELIFLLYFVL